MYQNEAAGGGNNLVPIGMAYRIVCNSFSGCVLFYYDEDGIMARSLYLWYLVKPLMFVGIIL